MDLGSGGHLYQAEKLPIIILLRLGLVAYHFHSGKNRKPLMRMVFGFWDVPMTPKNNYVFNFGDTELLKLISIKVQNK